MESVTPPGDPAHIRTIGESQHYRGLHVHIGVTFDHAAERQTIQMTTAYKPDADEIARIVAGAPIVVSIINVRQHPPISVGVGELP